MPAAVCCWILRVDDITRQCAAFDASIAAARTAQLELGVGIKAAEGQLLTMTRELAVLQVRSSRMAEGGPPVLAMSAAGPATSSLQFILCMPAVGLCSSLM